MLKSTSINLLLLVILISAFVGSAVGLSYSAIGVLLMTQIAGLLGIAILTRKIGHKQQAVIENPQNEAWSGFEALSFLCVCSLGLTLGFGLASSAVLLNFNFLQPIDMPLLIGSLLVGNSNNTVLYIFSGFVIISLVSLVFSRHIFTTHSKKRSHARQYLLLFMGLSALFMIIDYQNYKTVFSEDAALATNIAFQLGYLKTTFNILNSLVAATAILLIALLATRFIDSMSFKDSSAR